MTTKKFITPPNLFIAGFVLLLPVQYMPHQILGSLLAFLALATFLYGAFIASSDSKKTKADLAQAEKEIKESFASPDDLLDVTDNNELVIHEKDTAPRGEVVDDTFDKDETVPLSKSSSELSPTVDESVSSGDDLESSPLSHYGVSDSLSSLTEPTNEKEYSSRSKPLEAKGLESFFDDVDSFLASKAKDSQ